jgi:O-antigen/teichoic acid export membrane protein
VSWLRALWKPGDRLFDRAMSAGAWGASLRVFVRIALLIRTVILARLLVPDDFGLMAIATLAIVLVEQVTQSGFDQALVQRRDDIRQYLNTAWTVQVIRGAAMAAALAIAAPLIAGFFDTPEVTAIIRVLAVAVLIRAVANIAVVSFIKDLRFDLRFRYEIAPSITDAAVSIVAAIVLHSVWALVLGVLAGAVARVVASYVVHPYRPRLSWDGGQARLLFGFGKWVFVANLVNYATLNLDDIVVGRMLGTTWLGLYRMAYNFSQAVATELTGVVNQVAFPTYALLQEQADRLKTAFTGALHTVAFLAFPVGIGIALIAPDLTIGLLGDEWAPMIRAMQILAFAGLERALGAATGPLFHGLGRPDIAAKIAFIDLVIMVALLYPAVDRFGINGAAGLVVISYGVGTSALLILSVRRLGIAAADVFQSLGFPLLHGLAMAAVVLAARNLPIDRPSAVSFVVLTIIGALAYFAAVGVSMRFFGYQAPSAFFARLRGMTA